MKSIIFRLYSVLLCISLCLSAAPAAFAAETVGNVYYVSSENGIDAESGGSEEKPFKTIQYAADRMQAGDTCVIRGGVYRETVTVPTSGNSEKPVTFRAADGENVVLSGCELLSGWTNYKGNIYTADMNWNMYSGNGNMLFVNGELCTEARWPDSGDLLDINTYAKVDSADTSNGYCITDSSLPADVNFAGGMIGISSGNGYYSVYGKISAHDSAAHKLSYSMPNWLTSGYYPKAGNFYYVTRTLAALDSEKEWYKDISGGKMYFIAPEGKNPSEFSVEAKKREYALDLSGAAYVTIEGINIKGANIKTDNNTNNCTLKKCIMEAMDYKLSVNERGQAQPIVINGSHNTVTGCEIKNSHGGGLKLNGSYNRVINNKIHDVNFQHTNFDSGVRINGTHQLVSKNTVYNTGRDTISGSFKKSVISYNDLYNADKLSKDGGVIYLVNNYYQDSEIHHNLVHDNHGAGYQSGIYFDNSSGGLRVYNNVVYNIQSSESGANYTRPMTVNTPHTGSLIVNNTFAANNTVDCWPGTGKVSNTKLFNNLFISSEIFNPDFNAAEKGVVCAGNITNGSECLEEDYTVKGSSAAVDSGVKVPGITDGYAGGAPDCGAYEYGRDKWTAGCNMSIECDDRIAFNERIPFGNMLENGEFENALDGWTVESGSPEIISQSAWNYDDLFTLLGSKALVLKSGDKISRTVTGLKPNTAYTFSGFGKIGGKFVQAVDYKSLGGSFQYASAKAENVLYGLDDGEYAVYSVDFGNKIYDKLSVGTHSVPKGTASDVKKITVLLDSLNGAKLAEYTNSSVSELSTNDNWVWSTKNIADVSGIHDVYVKFSGTFDKGAFGGLILNSSLNADTAVISAKAGENEENTVISSADWKKLPDSVDVVTDAFGTVTLSIEKASGDYTAYLDDFNFSEKYSEGTEISDISVSVKSIKYMDVYGNVSSILKKNALNVVEVTAYNSLNTPAEVTGKLESCYSDGRVYDSCAIAKAFGGCAAESFGLGLAVPDDDGAYLMLTILQNGQTADYKITSGVVEGASEETGELSVKSVSLLSASRKELSSIKGGETNSVLMTVKNNTDNTLNAEGIAALYDRKGRLLAVKVLKIRGLAAGVEQTVTAGYLDVPNRGGLKIKVSLWKNVANMRPYCKMYVFN